MSDINPLDQSICFQLYVASKEIIRLYKPYLDEYNLTYTGFIAMIAIKDGMSVRALGEQLYLDSGTLSPLLKKLEKQSYIERIRSTTDERVMLLKITEKGNQLKSQLPSVAKHIYSEIDNKSPAVDFKQLLHLLTELNKKL